MLELYKQLEEAHQGYGLLIKNAKNEEEKTYLQASEESVLEAMADLENAIDFQNKSHREISTRLQEASDSLKMSKEQFQNQKRHAHESL